MSNPFVPSPYEPRKSWLLHEELGIIVEVKNIQIDVQYDVPDEFNLMEEIKWDFQQTRAASSTFPNLHPSSSPSRYQWNLRRSGLLSPPKSSPNSSPSSFLPSWDFQDLMFRALFGLPLEKPRQPEPISEKVDQPVIGFRAWYVIDPWSRWPRLQSLYHDRWEPGTTKATCRVPGAHWMPVHEAPTWDCECGLYVLNSLDDAPSWVPKSVLHPVAYGAVLGWGTVIEHGEEGWRAQYARPIAFLGGGDNPEAVLAVAKEYGVPVINNRKYLVHYAKEFGQSTQEGT